MTYHHTIADGRSGATVLLDVLRRAAGVVGPAVHKPARPSSQDLDLLSHQPALLGALKKTKFWLAAWQGRAAAGAAVARLRPEPDPRSRGSASCRLNWIGPRWPHLQRQARTNGTTIHGALGAAQLLAINAAVPRRPAAHAGADVAGGPSRLLDGRADRPRPWPVHRDVVHDPHDAPGATLLEARARSPGRARRNH